MKSLIENIGLALQRVKPPKHDADIAHHEQWKRCVDATAAVIVRPANLCSHPECIHQRYNDFVTLCETGKFPQKEKKADTPKHEEGDSLDVRIIKMSAAEALTLLGGMSLQQLLFGEDSDYVPDSIHRH